MISTVLRPSRAFIPDSADDRQGGTALMGPDNQDVISASWIFIPDVEIMPLLATGPDFTGSTDIRKSVKSVRPEVGRYSVNPGSGDLPSLPGPVIIDLIITGFIPARSVEIHPSGQLNVQLENLSTLFSPLFISFR